MPLRLPSLMLVRLCAALLLGVVGLQAADPASAVTPERSHGSAFSANTYEMALIVQRGDRVVRTIVAPQPVTAAPAALALVSAAVVALPPMPQARPPATGPPLRDILSWRPAPRAPPRA